MPRARSQRALASPIVVGGMLAALGPLWAMTACEPAELPPVQVRASVGEHGRFDAPEAQWQDLWTVLATALAPAEALHDPSPGASAGAAGDPVVRPPRTPEQLARALEAARSGEIEEAPGVARNLARTPPELWPELAAALAEEGPGSKLQMVRILDLFGGDAPNRYGHFDRHWKRDHGYAVKLSEDWLTDLATLPLGKVASSMRPVYRELLIKVALMHGAAHIAREDPRRAGEVVDALLDLAYARDGVFRDEVGRALASIGDPAVPRLVQRTPLPSTNPRHQDEVPVRQAMYAALILDRMDRMQPGRAIASVRDRPDALAALLAAYGDAKFGDAASHLLSHFDAPTTEVREAARDAFLSLVTGPPPRIEATRVRTLGGGTATRAVHLTYRGMATIAIRSELEQLAPALLEPEPPCEIRREDGSYDARCTEQPLRLTWALIGYLDEERRRKESLALAAAEAREAEDPDATMAAINELLATGIGQRRPEAVIPFVERAVARHVAAGNHRDAARSLRKLAHLVGPENPKQAQRLRARAFVHEARIPELSAQGRQMLLASALALAPADPEVTRAAVKDGPELLRANDPNGHAAASASPMARWLGGTLAALAALLALAGLSGWRHRRRGAALRG